MAGQPPLPFQCTPCTSTNFRRRLRSCRKRGCMRLFILLANTLERRTPAPLYPSLQNRLPAGHKGERTLLLAAAQHNMFIYATQKKGTVTHQRTFKLKKQFIRTTPGVTMARGALPITQGCDPPMVAGR